MLLQERAHIISLRWYTPSVLWLSRSIKTSPVDLFCSAWVGLCVQLQAEREMTHLFLEDKSLSFLTFPLVWQGGKKERNWLAVLVLSFRLFFSLSFFHFLSLTTRPSFALLMLLDSDLLLHPRRPLPCFPQFFCLRIGFSLSADPEDCRWSWPPDSIQCSGDSSWVEAWGRLTLTSFSKFWQDRTYVPLSNVDSLQAPWLLCDLAVSLEEKISTEVGMATFVVIYENLQCILIFCLFHLVCNLICSFSVSQYARLWDSVAGVCWPACLPPPGSSSPVFWASLSPSLLLGLNSISLLQSLCSHPLGFLLCFY